MLKSAQSKIKPHSINFKNMVANCNAAMTSLCDEIVKNVQPAPFGSNLASVTPSESVDSLVCHRIVNKFHIANETDRDLRSEAFAAYVDYESKTLSDVNSRFSIWESGRTGYVLRQARSFLHDMFKNYSVDLKNADVEFTSGESYISSQGEVSLVAKLADRSHWTTTWNCLEDTVLLIYHNASLKRVAKQHVGLINRKDRRKLYDRFRHYPDVGYAVFRHLLITEVLVIVDGARGSSVPKNNDKDRFINVEATFPMILQRLVAKQIRRVLKQHGNDLGKQSYEETRMDDAQAVHIAMISDSRFATIDFSNASDSVLWKVVCALFPAVIRNDLMKYRSFIVTLDDQDIEPLKLSSMGNGFTFEVMTSLLFSIGYMFSDLVRVYGDDVVIPNTCAQEFIDVCAYIGFSTNMDKTFVRSPFRESCGGFFHDEIGYLTSFAFGPIKSFQDVIITANKLRIIIDKKQVSDVLLDLLEKTHDRIIVDIPASRKGPLPSTDELRLQNLGFYVYDNKWRRRHTNNDICRNNHKLALKRFHEVFQSYQRDERNTCIVFVPVYVPMKSNKVRFERAVYAAFLYSGRSAKATIKGRGKWVDKPAIVTNDGEIFYLYEMAFIRQQIRKLTKNIALRDASMCNMGPNWEHFVDRESLVA